MPCSTCQRNGLDQDGDGYGDNATGLQLMLPWRGWHLVGGLLGCVDDDGDGYANLADDFPNDPTRWIDTDSDGFDDARPLSAERRKLHHRPHGLLTAMATASGPHSTV